MKILLGLDDQPYSEFAVRQTAKFAVNAWADVTMLTWVKARPKSAMKFLEISNRTFPVDPVFPSEAELLRHHWKIFLEHCPPDSPYSEESVHFHLVEIKDGVFEEIKVISPRRKELKLRLRIGKPAEGIIAEASEGGHDLIVIGCGNGQGCVWSGNESVPKAVVNGSSCSVLVVKQDQQVRKILCCFDQGSVSQESMEMINQLATMNQSSLNLVGLTRERAIRYDVDQELWRVQQYFSSKGIDTFVQLKEISELDHFLQHESKPDLLALWMGKRSLLGRFFPKGWAGNMVQNSPCSTIILR